MSIASTPYRELVAARLVSLRDFLLLFFCLELGVNLDMATLGGQAGSAIVFSLFVLIGNPLILTIIMGYMGYRKRTGFLAGLTVAQKSDFSLILAALGLALGHVDQQTVGLITLVGLITISASTYMILCSHVLYQWLGPYLVFERKVTHRELGDAIDDDHEVDVVLFGLGRFGALIAADLRARGCRLMAVDFDPEVVRMQNQDGSLARYGDAEDPEFVATLPLDSAKWVVSTLRDSSLNQALLDGLQQLDYKGNVAVSAPTHDVAERISGHGVNLVLVPYADAAKEAAERLWRDCGDEIRRAKEDRNEAI